MNTASNRGCALSKLGNLDKLCNSKIEISKLQETCFFQVEIIETKINDLLQYINNAMDMTRMVIHVSYQAQIRNTYFDYLNL